jgi:hypothetical protein
MNPVILSCLKIIFGGSSTVTIVIKPIVKIKGTEGELLGFGPARPAVGLSFGFRHNWSSAPPSLALP